MGDHFLVVGRVVAVSADDDAFDDHWLLKDNDAKPLHYLGGNHYAMLDDVMEARIPKRPRSTASAWTRPSRSSWS